jgi:hypothetical protein
MFAFAWKCYVPIMPTCCEGAMAADVMRRAELTRELWQAALQGLWPTPHRNASWFGWSQRPAASLPLSANFCTGSRSHAAKRPTL